MKSPPIRPLADHHEWLGYWWEASNPEARLPGVLRYTPGSGSVLTLVGGFDLNVWSGDITSGRTLQGTRDPGIILGDVNGSPISLLGCRCTHSVQHLAFPTFAQKEQTIEASTCLEGTHVQDEESTFIASYSVGIEGVELVFPSRRMFTSYSPPNDDRPRGEYHAEVTPGRDDIEWRCDTTTTDTVILERQWQQLSNGPADVHYTETAGLTCRFHQPRSLECVIDHAHDLQMLVALLLDQTPPIQRLGGMTVDGEPVNLLLHMDQSRDSQMNNDVARYPLVRDERTFAQVVSAWFELLAKTGAACRILVNMRYNRQTYLEHRLATVMTAAEQLHRGLFDSTPLMPDEFKRVKKMLKAAVSGESEDTRRWLGEVLQNRLSLRQRLDGLCDNLPSGVLSHILPNREAWLKAVNTRNTLTHTGESDDLGSTYAAVVTTEAILLAMVLDQLGLGSDEVLQSETFSRRWRTAKAQADHYFPSQSVEPVALPEEETTDA